MSGTIEAPANFFLKPVSKLATAQTLFEADERLHEHLAIIAEDAKLLLKWREQSWPGPRLSLQNRDIPEDDPRNYRYLAYPHYEADLDVCLVNDPKKARIEILQLVLQRRKKLRPILVFCLKKPPSDKEKYDLYEELHETYKIPRTGNFTACRECIDDDSLINFHNAHQFSRSKLGEIFSKIYERKKTI